MARLPCNEKRLQEIARRVQELNDGQASEDWPGEKEDLIKEQERLYRFEREFPHILIENEDGEEVMRYFKDEVEKNAFMQAYVVIRARNQAEDVIKKKATKKVKSER